MDEFEQFALSEDELSEFEAPAKDAFSEFEADDEQADIPQMRADEFVGGGPIPEIFGGPTQEQGVTDEERRIVKNLIDNDPQAIESYLKKKGYGNVAFQRGQWLVQKPGDKNWKVVDPYGFDPGDFSDHLFDLVEGTASLAATGLKSLPALGIAGGAISGGVEAGKQFLAKGAGAREEYDPARIAASTGIGAATEMIAGKLSGLGDIRPVKKPLPELKRIEEAAKVLKTAPTPSQKFQSIDVGKAEEAIREAPGYIAGSTVRARTDIGFQEGRRIANEILEDAEEQTNAQLSESMRSSILDSVSRRQTSLGMRYEKLDEMFGDYPAETSGIIEHLSDIRERMQGAPQARSLIDNAINELKKHVSNLRDLRNFKTSMQESARMRDIHPRLAYVYREAAGAAKDEEEALMHAYVLDLPEPDKENWVQFLRETDADYRKLAEDVKSVILRRGAKMKLSPEGMAETEFNKMSPSQTVSRIFDIKDPKRLKELSERFPEAFENARRAQLFKILDKHQMGQTGIVNPKGVFNEILNLEPKTAELLLGDEAIGKAKLLASYFNAFHPMYFPSGTPRGMKTQAMGNILEQLKAMPISLYLTMLTNPITRRAVFNKMWGRALGMGSPGIEQGLYDAFAGPSSEQILEPAQMMNRP